MHLVGRRIVQSVLTLASVLGIAVSNPAIVGAAPPARGTVLADFESGSVILESYGNEDHDPTGWELTDANTHGGSAWSLRLTGNTWKTQPIAAHAVSQGTVFSVAAYIEDVGEIQAFGITDGANVLFYTFAGTELPSETEWETTYQGAFPNGQWNVYLLPIGRDWRNRYGYDPTITNLVYVNDKDSTTRGVTMFDDIVDVTSDLPVAPTVEIRRGRQRAEKVEANLWRVGVQFDSRVEDPDSEEFTYFWDFGDSTFSDASAPFHEFLVSSDHTYTVSLAVRDEFGMWGRDSAQVRVDPAPEEPLSTIDFVGDVMLGRAYDIPGGLIDQHGPEYIFMPTRPIFGDAAEVNVCNLEGPLTDEGVQHPTKPIVFRARPSNVRGLTYAGVDLVTIANNHIVDYGGRGCEETQQTLDAAGIHWFGAGLDEYVAFQSGLWTQRGIALGFLGMCNRTGREYNYQPFLDAAGNKPGFAWLTGLNLDAAIATLRPLADLVILQAHAGIEYETDPGKRGDGSGSTLAGDGAFDAIGGEPGISSDFRFPTRPNPTDRQLKQRAIDQGTDLVIGHHPHVLQGFEVYHGRLIVHSLGNFVFDQSYAETMPSLILYADFDKTGFRDFTFRPIFINDMIPVPVTGRLGREILDRQADYSRELNTVVTIDPVACIGTIRLAPGDVQWTVEAQEKNAEVTAQGDYWVSAPIERDGLGTLSRIVGIEGVAGQVEVRVGREILWHGDMEEEGATFWDLNSADEVYDGTIARTGRRSLHQHRTSQNSGAVTTDLKGYPATLGGTDFTISGWLRTQDARETTVTARMFTGRGGNPVATADAGPALSGTHDWTYMTSDFTVPTDVSFFNVRCRMNKPTSGESDCWFDDLRLVEWEPWKAVILPMDFAYPSNLRFIQVRCSSPTPSVHVQWEDVRVAQAPSDVAQDARGESSPLRLQLARPHPNPFRGETVLDYLLPRGGQARLEIINVTGRRIALLADGPQAAGWHRVRWDAKGFASGLYLGRLTWGGEIRTGKLLLLH